MSTTDATPIPGTRLTLGLKGLGLEYRRTSPNTRFSAHADFLGGDFSEPRWGHFRGLDASEKRFDIDAMGRVYGPLYGEAGFGVNSFKIGNGFGTFSHGFGRALQEQTVTDIQGGLGVAFGSLRDDRFHVKFGGLYAQQHQTLNGFSWNNNRLGITGGLNVPFNKGNLLLDYDHWLKISGDLLEGHGTGDRLNAELTVDPGRPGGLGFRFGVSPVDNRFLPYDGTVFRPQKANWGKIYFGVTLLGGDRR